MIGVDPLGSHQAGADHQGDVLQDKEKSRWRGPWASPRAQTSGLSNTLDAPGGAKASRRVEDRLMADQQYQWEEVAMHFIFRPLKSLAVAGVAAAALLSAAPMAAQAQQSEPIHIALADLPEVETLFFLVGLARAQERGLEAELTFFNGEDLAIQAILAGQADIGLGSPYQVIQRANVPVRLFQQVSKIIFFPVVKAEIETWQDMDGRSMTFHQRGGPLEALAEIVAEREGITFGRPNYVPGSQNRVVALMEGHIEAALIDLLNKNMIMAEAPGRFHVLPWVDEVITDEALFARLDWLQENEEQVKILVEEMLGAARDICENPAIIAEEREKYNLLPDLPEELASGLADYYTEAIEANVYSCDGGSVEAVETDLAVLSRAGQLQGSAEELKVEDFWYLDPLLEVKGESGNQ